MYKRITGRCNINIFCLYVPVMETILPIRTKARLLCVLPPWSQPFVFNSAGGQCWRGTAVLEPLLWRANVAVILMTLLIYLVDGI